MATPRPHILDYVGSVATHGKNVPKVIVIHDTESRDVKGIRDITGIFDYWQRNKKETGLGAHFVIDSEGYIAQGAWGWDVTWAVAGHNHGCIHIELVGFARFSRKDWQKRAAQLDALSRLLAYLSDRWSIPLRSSTEHGVTGHANFHAGHTDPGKGFPFADVLRSAKHFKGARS